MATDTVVKNFILNKMTQAQYNALESKDANQLYFLLDAQSVSKVDFTDVTPTPAPDANTYALINLGALADGLYTFYVKTTLTDDGASVENPFAFVFEVSGSSIINATYAPRPDLTVLGKNLYAGSGYSGYPFAYGKDSNGNLLIQAPGGYLNNTPLGWGNTTTKAYVSPIYNAAGEVAGTIKSVIWSADPSSDATTDFRGFSAYQTPVDESPKATAFYNSVANVAGKNYLIFTVPGAVTAKTTSAYSYYLNTAPVELLLTVAPDSPSSSGSLLELKVVFNRSGAKVLSENATGIFEGATYSVYYNKYGFSMPAFVVELEPNLGGGGPAWAVLSSIYGGRGYGWAPSVYFTNEVDTSQFEFIANVPVVKPSVGTDNNGIKGDYFATWGWMEGSNGLPTIVSGSNNIKIPAGTILMCPGSDGYITISSDTTFENNLTGDFTLFYARNLDGTGAGFIAATEVVWSDTEPEPNGQTGFQAWKKSGSSNWQLRSNDSGNVWREVVGGPIADVHYTDGNATRIDFDGYRQFNKQQYLKTTGGTMEDGSSINASTKFSIKAGIREFVFSSGGYGAFFSRGGLSSLGDYSAVWGALYCSSIYKCGTIEANGGAAIIVPKTGGTMVVATPPTTAGNYVLKATVAEGGTVTTQWVAEV